MVKDMEKAGKIEEIIQAFDQCIKAAYEQISDTVQEISDTDGRVRRLVLEFKDAMDRLSVSESNLFEKELLKLLEQYQANGAKWCGAVNAMVEGKEFINQFEKSVLIVVFGNVNVGKSAVGNIIAGTIDPDGKGACENDSGVLKRYFGGPPVFYEYDFAGNAGEKGAKEKKESFFKEGYVETTANIQYFTRNGGMTWTDSPGICSVNWQNGDLAKKYVEYADLVIFITLSSSPAKEDEIQELKKLFSKKKPVLILLNKSDKRIHDEVDGRIVEYLVSKPQADREKQEDYVQEQFCSMANEILSETDTVSVSVYLAMEALREENAEKFVQSGFPRFYEKLGKIFEENAVELKMNAPRQRVNAMIDEIISGGTLGAQHLMGIRQYQESLGEMKARAERTKEEIGRATERAVPAILNKSMERITSAVQEQAYQVRKSGESADLSGKINEIVTSTTAEILERQLREVLTDYSNGTAAQAAYQTKGTIRLDARMEQTERYVYDVRNVSRNPEGLIEHIQSLVFKKEFTRSDVKRRRVTDTFVNGDNSLEILERIRQETSVAIQGYVRDFVQKVQEQYFRQEEILIEKIMKMLGVLEEKLKGEKMGDGRKQDSGL